jgi:hypothetical protein
MRVFIAAVGVWVAQALVVPKEKTQNLKPVQEAAKKTIKKELPTLASSLAALSHHRGYVSQEPAVSPEVDKEAYEADWGTEHRSEDYPESSRGKQHHPSYHYTTRFEAYVGLAWYYILAILLLIGGAGYAVFAYMKKE